jgi:hypothetical protein
MPSFTFWVNYLILFEAYKLCLNRCAWKKLQILFVYFICALYDVSIILKDRRLFIGHMKHSEQQVVGLIF